MDEGEFVEADDSSIGGGGPAIIPCNWLQHFENVVDPYHVPVLHGSFSGPQFTNMMASVPEVTFEMSPRGVTVRAIRNQDDGKVFYRITEAALPTLRVESIGWTLPIDDVSFRIYVVGRVKRSGDIGRMRSKFNGKFWWDMTEEEHQRFPGDYEAQVGQGPLTIHSEEHFGQSDRGILMIRRMLGDQLEALAAGRDPIGVWFDDNAPPVAFEAGNYIREAKAGLGAGPDLTPARVHLGPRSPGSWSGRTCGRWRRRCSWTCNLLARLSAGLPSASTTRP